MALRDSSIERKSGPSSSLRVSQKLSKVPIDSKSNSLSPGLARTLIYEIIPPSKRPELEPCGNMPSIRHFQDPGGGGGGRDVVAQVPADAIFLVRCYGCMPGGGIFKHSRPENGHSSSHAAICQVLGTSKIRAAGGARGVVAQAPADAIFLVRCYGSPLNRLHLPPA